MKQFFKETCILLKQELLIVVRNPFWIFFGLFQPIVYLLFFAPLLNGVASSSGLPGNNAIQFFAPGLLIMNAMMNAGYAGFTLLDKITSGFLERLRVTPINRLSLVLGLVLVNTITLIIQSILLVGVSMILGLKISVSGFLILLMLLLLIGTAMASASYGLALIIKDGGILSGAISFFNMPLMLLSGVMLPMNFAPKFLQMIAKLNPFYHAVNAARILIEGPQVAISILIAFIAFGCMALLALWWFIRMMREAVS